MVRIVRLPRKPDRSKQAPDDFLAAGGTIEEAIEHSLEFDGTGFPNDEWPIMAEEAFYGLAGDVVRTIEPHTEADPAGLLAPFLVEYGNVIYRGAHFKVEGDTHYCKEFLVQVGESSKGRKGTGQGRIGDLMKHLDSEWAKNCTTSGLSSGEGLIHSVRDQVVKDVDGEEKVVDPGVSDKRLMVEESEFGSTLTVSRRQGNTLNAVIRNAWDDKPLRTLTKNSSEVSSYSHISIVAHITKHELLRHLTEEKLGSGVANRFMFVLVRRSKILPLGGAMTGFDDKLVKELQDAVSFGKVPRLIHFSDDVEDNYGYSARELWEHIYPALSEAKPGLFGAVVSRAEAHTRRLATIYAALDQSAYVRVAHLLAALAVWQYAEDSARLIFGERIGDVVADEIVATLSVQGDEGLTLTQIHDLFGRHLKKTRIMGVLMDLEAQGRVVKVAVKTEGPGRPPQKWVIADA